MDLFKQLEDKKKGCGKNLGAYMEVPKEYENAPDKIKKEKSFSVEVVCGKQEYCKTCQAEIAILEQAIAEMQKQRQEEIEFLKKMVDNDNGEECNCEFCSRINRLKEQQLNQPKTEQ